MYAPCLKMLWTCLQKWEIFSDEEGTEMNVTSEFLDIFRKEFNEAVETLCEKYDISMQLGRITYSNESFSATLSVNMTRDPEDIARANFDADAWKFEDIGITEGMYKRIFIGTDKKKYAIVGLQPRSYKQPLCIVDVDDGSRYKAGRMFIKEWTDFFYAETKDQKGED